MTDVRPYVSEALAARLTPERRFQLPPATAPDDVPIISEKRARELAHAYLRSWGRALIPQWAERRGETLELDQVAPSDRVFFAQSALGRVPDDVYNPAHRRMYGPMYVVHVESRGEVVALLCISAYNTDVGINVQGRVERPALGGSDFFPTVVAPNPSQPRFRFVAVSPEAAARYVAERTGARVTEVPDLLVMTGYHPASAAWRIRLDRPVQVRGIATPQPPSLASPAPDSAPFPVRELYVTNDYVLTVPAPEQPSHRRIFYPTQPGDGPLKMCDLPRREGLPIVHQTVAIDPEGTE